jgi:hypothetical protein
MAGKNGIDNTRGLLHVIAAPIRAAEFEIMLVLVIGIVVFLIRGLFVSYQVLSYRCVSLRL